jgi:hypothetical protein
MASTHNYHVKIKIHRIPFCIRLTDASKTGTRHHLQSSEKLLKNGRND